MNRKTYLTLALIILISGAIGFSLLTRGQPWLDDFAEYLMQARSILNHSMGDFIRQNTFTVVNSSYPPGPVAYPWGFPLLLAPVYAVFGMNTLALKLVNSLFYALFLLVFFMLARTRLKDHAALILTAALGFNLVLLQALDQLISDIPFLFFSTLGILLIDRTARQKATLRTGLAIGVVLFMAAFIRTNGILLLLPLALVQLGVLWPQRDNRELLLAGLRSSAIPYLAFGLLYALQALIFPNAQDSYLSHFSMFTPVGLWGNLLYYLWLPASTFNGLPAAGLPYPVMLVFVVISASHRRERDLAVHAYALVTTALFIVWPERQGLRFIYPILPFLFIFAWDGMDIGLSWLRSAWQRPASIMAAGFWVLLATLSLGVSVALAQTNLAGNRTVTGPFDSVSAEMFKFLREKTPSDSAVIFFKPRAMRLFTDRDAFITDNCANLSKAGYLAVSKKVEANGLIPLQELTVCTSGPPLQKVFENRRFTVYRIGN